MTAESWSSERKLVVALGSVFIAVLVFVALTLVTGFPGPGALRRYPRHDLDDLVERMNAEADLSVLCSVTEQKGPSVHVDVIRSRVVVDRAGALAAPLTPDEQAMVVGEPLYRAVSCGPS